MASPMERLRDHLDLSRAEFAEELGIARSRVYQIELEGSRIGPDVAEAIWTHFRRDLKRLGISLEELMGFEA